MNQNEGQGKLPAGTILNPSFEQAKVITTSSGKVLGQAVPIQEEQEAVDTLKSQVERDPATSRAENPPRAKTGEKILPEPNVREPSDTSASYREHSDTAHDAEAPRQTNKSGKLKGKTSNPSN